MTNSPYSTASILVLHDPTAHDEMLPQILTYSGYTNVRYSEHPCDIAALLGTFEPQLIIVESKQRDFTACNVMQDLRHIRQDQFGIPVLVLLDHRSVDAKLQALEAGARDILTKPYEPLELVVRIRNLLEAQWLYKELQQRNETLEARVRERTEELERAQIETLARLARAVEYRDDDTGQHPRRVGRLAARLAAALDLPAEYITMLEQAAPLHDAGKVSIPDNILRKPDRLNADELALVRTHTTIGYEILAGSQYSFMDLAAEVALTHHERWDGFGYPQGLAGAAIPISGRIVGLADAFDSLTHDRPYHPAWSISDAKAEIKRQSGKHFDPEMVNVFLQIVQHEDEHAEDGPNHSNKHIALRVGS